MRAGQYSARLCRPRKPPEGVQDGPRLLDRRRLLEGLTDRLVGAETLGVPGVELAQVAAGAGAAEVLDGAIHDPIELLADLIGRRFGGAGPEQLREQPRIAERAPREHDGGGAGALVGGPDRGCVREAAGQDHRRLERLHEPRGERVVRRALVVDGGAPRVKADRAHAGVVDEAVGELEAVGLAGALAGAELDGDRQAAAFPRRLGDGDRGLRVLDERGAGAGLADLRDGAAHVEVDEVRPALGDRGGRGAHDLRILAEELDRDRPAAVAALIRVDPEHLDARLLVAVVDPEARDHLRHGEAGSVALGLQADEPVADAGERREDHAVRDADGADVEGVGEGGGRHAFAGAQGSCVALGRSWSSWRARTARRGGGRRGLPALSARAPAGGNDPAPGWAEFHKPWLWNSAHPHAP